MAEKATQPAFLDKDGAKRMVDNVKQLIPSDVDADTLGGSHKNELLTSVSRSGEINNTINVAVGGTTKSANLYPDTRWGTRLLMKPDNGGRRVACLIADITSWKGATSNAGHFGFTGRMVDMRVEGYMVEGITDVICRCGHTDTDKSKGQIHLYTSDSDRAVPKIIKNGNNYYLAIIVTGSGHRYMMEGFFVDCLNEFIYLNYDANGNLPTGASVVEGYPTDGDRVVPSLLTNEDLDSLRTAMSQYYAASGNTCLHKPAGVDWFGLVVVRSAQTHVTQILTSSNKGTYIRHYTGSSWTGWLKQLEENDDINADSWEGSHQSDFRMIRKFDVNLKTLDSTKFYPVVFNATSEEIDCSIVSPSFGSSDPYNRNHVHFLLRSNGWNDTKADFIVLSQGNFDNNEISIGAVGSGTRAGLNCVWLRGGLNYSFACNLTPTLHTADYTSNGETFSVGTNYDGGTNANVTIRWKNDSTRSNAHVAKMSDTVETSRKVSITQLTTEDLDTIKPQAFASYWGNASNTCANKPTGVTIFNLTIHMISSRFCQVLIDQNGNIWIRLYISTWGTWQKVTAQDDYAGVFIMYHRASDSVPCLCRTSEWTALQASGVEAEGVAIMDGGKILVVSTTESQNKWCSQNISMGETATTSRGEAINDFNGKGNTSTIIKTSGFSVVGQKLPNPFAAKFCYDYDATSSENDNGGLQQLFVSRWWLPSVGELMLMMANFDKINYALSLIDGAAPLQANWYWSSTEYDAERAWFVQLSLSAANINHALKNANSAFIRPVTTFEW